MTDLKSKSKCHKCGSVGHRASDHDIDGKAPTTKVASSSIAAERTRSVPFKMVQLKPASGTEMDPDGRFVDDKAP